MPGVTNSDHGFGEQFHGDRDSLTACVGARLSPQIVREPLDAARLCNRQSISEARTRDWVAECTSAPHVVMELALAHSVGSSVERAYARSDMIEKHRDLMRQWADFVAGGGAEVVRLQG